jgi:ribulose kinase
VNAVNVSANGDALCDRVDCGTLSGRALVVHVSDGSELGSAVHPYRHAVIEQVLRSIPATNISAVSADT